MAILKVLEILTESDKGWEDAVQHAVDEASKTVHNIRSVNIKNMSAEVENNRAVRWRINCQITFELEGKNRV